MRVRTEREREKERREKRVSFLGEREKPFLSIDAQKIAASALIRDPIFSQKIDGAPDNLEAFNFSTTRVARGFIERRAHTRSLSFSLFLRALSHHRVAWAAPFRPHREHGPEHAGGALYIVMYFLLGTADNSEPGGDEGGGS